MTSAGTAFSRTLVRAGRRVCGSLLAASALAGCEAPLELDGVNAMRAEPIHRMDRYQSAASFGAQVVVVGNQGVVLTSGDYGSSWEHIELPGWPALIDTSETPQSITCAPDGRIWVVGSFTNIWSSDDGGGTWAETMLDEDAIFTTVEFFDADNGIITGEFGIALRTTDGGESWERLPPLPGEFYPQEAFFEDPTTGWLIGLGGSVLHTTDGGNTWTHQKTPTQVSLFAIERVGGELLVVGGEGTMLAYRDGTWRQVDHGKPVRLYLRVLQALDDTRVLIGGVGGTLHVVDTTGV